MTGKTHACMGGLFGVGFAVATGAQQDVVSLSIGVCVSVLASLLPDLDHDGSYISKYLTLNSRQQNRSLITMLLGIFLITLCLYLSLPIWIVFVGSFFIFAAYIKHRTFTHSILGVIFVCIAAYLAAPNVLYFGFFITGYISHLFADALTVSGIPLLWPKSYNFRLARIKTSTKWDTWIGYFSLGSAMIGYMYMAIQILKG